MLPPATNMQRIIQISSLTGESNGKLVRFLTPLLRQAGLHVKTQTVNEGGVEFHNLLGFSHPEQAGLVLALNTHLDTVSAGNPELWTSTQGDPFRLTRKGNKLFGLGTADVKLDFLCKLEGIRGARPWKFPFVLVGTFGEERGLVGATSLFAGGIVSPKYALVGEPSNLELIYTHKGHLIAALSLAWPKSETGRRGTGTAKQWRGQAAHSSTPNLGKNALEMAIREICKKGWGLASIRAGTDSNRVPELCEAIITPKAGPTTRKLLGLWYSLNELARELRLKKDTRFSPDYVTLSTNKIRTFNGRLELVFDIRTLPGTDSHRLEQRIRLLAQKHGFKVDGLSCDPPLEGNRTGSWVRHCEKVLKRSGHRRTAVRTKASSTEAAVYAQHGADALVFGPGVSVGNVHRPNEHCLISQMETATQFYCNLLQSPPDGDEC